MATDQIPIGEAWPYLLGVAVFIILLSNAYLFFYNLAIFVVLPLTIIIIALCLGLDSILMKIPKSLLYPLLGIFGAKVYVDGVFPGWGSWLMGGWRARHLNTISSLCAEVFQGDYTPPEWAHTKTYFACAGELQGLHAWPIFRHYTSPRYIFLFSAIALSACFVTFNGASWLSSLRTFLAPAVDASPPDDEEFEMPGSFPLFEPSCPQEAQNPPSSPLAPIATRPCPCNGADVDALKAQISHLEEEKGADRRNNQETIRSLWEEISRAPRLDRKKSGANAKVAQLAGQLGEKDLRIEALEASIEELKISAASAANHSSRSALDATAPPESAVTKELGELKAELERKKGTFATQCEQLLQANGTIDRMKADLENATWTAQAAAQGKFAAEHRVNELATTIQNASQTYNQALQERDSLRAQLNAVTEQSKGQSRRIARLVTENEDVQQNIDFTKGNLEVTTEDLRAAQKELADAQKRSLDQRRELEVTDGQLGRLQFSYSTKAAEVGDLQNKLAAAQRDLADAPQPGTRPQTTSDTAEVDDLRTKLDTAQQDLEAADGQLGQLQIAYGTKAAEAGDLQTKLAAAQRDLAAAPQLGTRPQNTNDTAEVDVLRTKLNTAQLDLEAAYRQLSHLQIAHGTKAAEVGDLHTKLAGVQRDLAEMRVTAGEREAYIRELKGEVEKDDLFDD